MDHDAIEKYLLKVGRSYYRSSEFMTRYRFRPTSEFGIGLLSCFMVANSIEIETLREDSVDGPIHLTIPPWRQYMLTKPGVRSTVGTAVTLRLGSIGPLSSQYASLLEFDKELGRDLPHSPFGAIIQGTARHVEFPIHWQDNEASGVVTDPWDLEPAGDRWLQVAQDLWCKCAHVPEAGATVRYYLGSFPARIGNINPQSKEGIACTAEGTSGESRFIRKDTDFRGQHAPQLTVDRGRFVRHTLRSRTINYLNDQDTLALASDPGGPFPRTLRRVAASRLPHGRELASHLIDLGMFVWVFRDGAPKRCALAHAADLCTDQVDVNIESVPGCAEAECTQEGQVVIPLFEEDAGAMVAGVLLRRTLWIFRDRIRSIDGHRTACEQQSTHMELVFEIDTGPWAAARVAPTHWVISDAMISMLRERIPNCEEPPFVPCSRWRRWGAVLHSRRLGPPALTRSLESGDLRQGPPAAGLTGAAYVMYTLQQNFPEIERDLITDEMVPPRDRTRGFASDYDMWLRTGTIRHPDDGE